MNNYLRLVAFALAGQSLPATLAVRDGRCAVELAGFATLAAGETLVAALN